MSADIKGYGEKESTDLLAITQQSIEDTKGISIFSRNHSVTFLKVDFEETWLTFNAFALGEESRDYMPDNVEGLAKETISQTFKDAPEADLSVLTNHIMRRPSGDEEGKRVNKRNRNTFVKTLDDCCRKRNCVLPSGETADMNTLDEGSFYGGVSIVSFGETGDYKVNLKDRVIATHADGIGTKPEAYKKLLDKGLISLEKFLGFVQDGLAMNLNDFLVGLLGLPKQTYMTNNIVIGRGFEDKEELIIKELERLSNETGIIIAKNNVVYRPDFKGVELDMVLTIIHDENKIPDMKVKAGYKIIGIRSNGIHSNGLSGARRYIEKLAEEMTKNIADESLRYERKEGIILEFYKKLAIPTPLYHKLFKALEGADIKSAVNITGDAFKKVLGILPEDLEAIIDNPQEPQELFKEIYEKSEFTDDTMYDYFNCGTGLMLVVPEEAVEDVLGRIGQTEYQAQLIGELREGPKQITINSAFSDKIITYSKS